MDWNAAADAFLKVWRETSLPSYGGAGVSLIVVAILAWKFLDAWGKRRTPKE